MRLMEHSLSWLWSEALIYLKMSLLNLSYCIEKKKKKSGVLFCLIGTWSWETPEVYFQSLFYLKHYQNLKLLLFFIDWKKNLPENVKNNCLYILEPNDFTLLSFKKANTLSWINLELFFISWKCFHGLVAWSRLFMWSWLGCLACISIFTSVAAVGLFQHRNFHKWQTLGVSSGQTRIVPHLCGVACFLSMPKICESASAGQAVGTSQGRHSSSGSHREWLGRRRGQAGSVPVFLQLCQMHHTRHSCLHTKAPIVSH